MIKTRPEEEEKRRLRRRRREEEEEDDTDGCEEDEGGGTPSPDTIAKAPASSLAKRSRLGASVTSKIVARKTFNLFVVFFLPFLSLNISISETRRSSLTPPWQAVKRKRNARRQANRLALYELCIKAFKTKENK